jgi:hypothetical protein
VTQTLQQPTDVESRDRNPTSPPATDTSGADVALRVVLGLVVVGGVLLRFWNAGSNIPFQDEVHAIGSVVQHDYRWIATHFGAFDHCIPLTLYFELLSHTIGLGEWGLRLPGLLCGSAALVLFAQLVRRVLRPTEAVLCVGLLSLSPYLVYLSREARPYPVVIFLFLIATVEMFRWLRHGGRRHLLTAAIVSALSLYFQPVLLPSVAVLALLPFVPMRAKPQSIDRSWRDVAVAGGLFTALCVALIGPAVPDLIEQSAWKVGHGRFDLDSLRAGWMLVHGTVFDPPLALQIAWGVAGVALIAVRFPVEALSASAMVIAQLVVIAVTQPTMAEQSFVWLRYLSHLLPFVAVVATAPLAWGIDALARHSLRWHRSPGSLARHASLAAAAIAIAAFTAGHIDAERYALGDDDAYNRHPWLMYLMKPETAARFRTASAFYSTPFELPAGTTALIEAPLGSVFPVAGIYQRNHRHKLYAAVGSGGYWAKYFHAAPGIEFRTIIDLEQLSAESRPEDAGLLIWHKRIRAETGRAMTAALDETPAGLHSPPEHRFFELLDLDFGRGDPPLPPHIARDFETVYEDAAIRVFRLTPPER